jgi:hypothetical protein
LGHLCWHLTALHRQLLDVCGVSRSAEQKLHRGVNRNTKVCECSGCISLRKPCQGLQIPAIEKASHIVIMLLVGMSGYVSRLRKHC